MQTVEDKVDFLGQEFFLEILHVLGPSRPFRRTIHDTSMHSGQKLCQMHISTTYRPKERQGPSSTMRRPSTRCKSDNLKGVRFGKMNYSAHADRPEARSDHPRHTLSDICGRI
jgi:hypothetical protein